MKLFVKKKKKRSRGNRTHPTSPAERTFSYINVMSSSSRITVVYTPTTRIMCTGTYYVKLSKKKKKKPPTKTGPGVVDQLVVNYYSIRV